MAEAPGSPTNLWLRGLDASAKQAVVPDAVWDVSPMSASPVLPAPVARGRRGAPGLEDRGVGAGRGFPVRMSTEERTVIENAARQAGYGRTAEWLRMVGLRAAERAVSRRLALRYDTALALVEELARLRAEVRRIGVNVNQQTAAINHAAKAEGRPVNWSAVRSRMDAWLDELHELSLVIESTIGSLTETRAADTSGGRS